MEHGQQQGEFWTVLITSITSLVGGIVGGGGLLKLYQGYKKTSIHAARAEQEYINEQKNEMLAEYKLRTKSQEKKIDKLETEFAAMKEKYNAVLIEKMRLTELLGRDECNPEES